MEFDLEWKPGFRMSKGGVLELDIFANTSKQLQIDNGGVLFTHRLGQNPPLPESHVPFPSAKSPSEVHPSYSSAPSQAP